MKRWIVIIWAACCIGVIWACLSNGEYYRYCVTHHLYNLGFRAAAISMDRLSVTALAAFAVLYAAAKLCAYMAEYHRASISILPSALTVGVLGPHQNAKALDFGDVYHLVVEFARDQVWQILLAVIVLIIGASLMARVRGHRVPLLLRILRAYYPRLDAAMCRVIPAAARFCRFLWPFAAAIVAVNLCALGFFVQRNLSLANEPNVIIIMADTTRADHLNCYGYGRRTSPNIDRLASDGIRFQQAISQAPFTRWSVDSFMTSTYPESAMPEGVPIEEFLSDRGYTTGGIVSNRPTYADDFMIHRRFDYWNIKPCEYGALTSSPSVLSSALNWLDRVRNRKFFMFVLFADPHSPYTLHKGYDFDPENDGVMPDKVDVTSKNTDPSVTAAM